jgi:hypothetical protein
MNVTLDISVGNIAAWDSVKLSSTRPIPERHGGGGGRQGDPSQSRSATASACDDLFSAVTFGAHHYLVCANRSGRTSENWESCRRIVERT